MYTHYSLFMNNETLNDFDPLPKGGLPELLRTIHSSLGVKKTHCAAVGSGVLHPDGEQISFTLGRGEFEHKLILMTRDCVRDHAADLQAECNYSSAKKAHNALEKTR